MPVALGILRLQQHRKEIVALRPRLPARIDQSVNDLVQSPAPRHHPPYARQRQPLDQSRKRKHDQVERIHHGRERLADLVGNAVHVGTEERFSHDAEGEPAHFPRNVHFPPVPPALHHAPCFRAHLLRKSGDPLAMESRLHHPALAQMVRALAREQTCAQHALHPLKAASLVKIFVIRHEDFADQIGIVQQVHPLEADAEIDAIAVFACQAGQDPKAVPRHAEKRDFRGGKPGPGGRG